MKRIDYYYEARQEYIERTRSIGNALTISVTIALSIILAFAFWLELEFGLLSNLWFSIIR
ncbi:hypothetical protein LZ575_07315 [Antarcticibacterium sp. 1MA-6-2]|uniref:hypothetical protein n=1 Tax=Antarcticibacterium sp. 1MA-6-2 TaxID=2908210 RepID=UPI001F2C3C9F|nr:hypothetical protein [Antarcticibacterium sp. 1MA-6-2]UJH92330.1 hypothetical protein LZ575_07315 [Antarcticibacterium sp. 1MA-6-2]